MISIETQKRLTEFLGEKYHASVGGGMTGTRCICGGWWSKCYGENRLDFTDWRVVGRLIEKVEGDVHILGTEVLGTKKKGAAELINGYRRPSYYRIADTPQEAICLAIDSYLKEREGK